MKHYKLKFLPVALKEWKKIDSAIRQQFKTKLSERLKQPHIEAGRLTGFTNTYKIKLRSLGYRLVYQVVNNECVVVVIAVGKRENDDVYNTMKRRMNVRKDTE